MASFFDLPNHLRIAKYLVCVAVIAVAGCGGGGGGGGGTPDVTDVRVQGQSSSFSSTIAFPLTVLMPGDSVQLSVVGTTTSGGTFTLGGSGWTIDAPSTVATINSGGVLTAVDASDTTYSATATYKGTSYTVAFKVVPTSKRAYGFVRNTSGVAVSHAAVYFYNNSGTKVGETTTDSRGVFATAVPSNATRWIADFSWLIDYYTTNFGYPGYYNQFGYGSFDYTTSIEGCSIPMPTVGTGNWSLLSEDIVVYPNLNSSSTPPPPPTGCGFG